MKRIITLTEISWKDLKNGFTLPLLKVIFSLFNQKRFENKIIKLGILFLLIIVQNFCALQEVDAQEGVEKNPFGLTNVGINASQTFVDLDNDGDQDMLATDNSVNMRYYENIGTATAPAFDTREINPFGLVGFGRPTTADLDGDGDFDILLGGSGDFRYLQNIGTDSDPNFMPPVTNAFGLTSIGFSTSPHFVDLDDDGDMDILVISGTTMNYFENTGTSTMPAFGMVQEEPFGLTSIFGSSVTTIDIDKDGDLDAFISDPSGGTFSMYENNGTANAPSFIESSYDPYNNVRFNPSGVIRLSLSMVDLFNDGDPDLMIGLNDGSFNFIEIDISTIPAEFLDGVENAFNLEDINSADNGSSPAFADLDNDGDLDVLVGVFDGFYHYFRNNGTSADPDFDRSSVPLGLQDQSGLALVPSFADLDNDGDLDLITGDNVGDFYYQENTGTISSPTFADPELNALGLVRISQRVGPALADLDNDGDYDLMAGSAANGEITYFENTGTVTAPSFGPPQIDPFGLEANGFASSIIRLADLDGDNDLDLILGSFSSSFLYAENIGTVNLPDFALPRPFISVTGSRSALAIADLDDDTDLDILIGSFVGDFYFYENTTIFINNPPIFTPPSNVISFNENSTDVVIDLNANDGDNGEDDEGITYTISGGDDAALFSINMMTGELSFINPPDFEMPLNMNGSFYSLTVQADDGMPINNISTQPLNILVRDVSEPLIWLGNNNNWNDATNWSTGIIPDEDEDVTIPNTANQPVINAAGNAVNLIVIEDGATLTIEAGFGLAIFDDATTNGSGNVTITRNVESNGGFSIVGGSFAGQEVGDFGADLIYTYSDITNAFSVPNLAATAAGGDGFFVAYNRPNASITISGEPNSGQRVNTLFLRGSSENGIADGFNLVANPFIGAIDRSELINSNFGRVDGTIWLWNDGGGNSNGLRTGDYVAVNDAGVTSSDPSITITSDTPIGAMQGFFIRASRDLAALVINPRIQVIGGNSDDTFFRNELAPENKIKISLSGKGKNEGLYNDLIVTLREDASTEHDFALDAEKFSGNENISFYTLQGDLHYAIQALPINELEITEVPIGFYLKNEGSYQLKIEDLTTIDEHFSFYLIDQFTNDVFDLNKNTIIDFAIDGEGSINDRYLLQFVPNVVTALDDSLADQLKLLQATETSLTISYPGNNERVELYDLVGRTLYSEKLSFVEGSQQLYISLEQGEIYILKVGNETIKFRLNN